MHHKSQITVARIRNKIRDDWMSTEQQLKLAVMDSVGDTIRHIIAIAASKLCENPLSGHHQMVTILKDYDHDYPDLHTHTFAHLTAYLELHLPNVVSHDDATKAHGLSTQINSKPGDDILLNMNTAKVTAYLALQDEVKKTKEKSFKSE
jgi:hypothetical protein